MFLCSTGSHLAVSLCWYPQSSNNEQPGRSESNLQTTASWQELGTFPPNSELHSLRIQHSGPSSRQRLLSGPVLGVPGYQASASTSVTQAIGQVLSASETSFPVAPTCSGSIGNIPLHGYRAPSHPNKLMEKMMAGDYINLQNFCQLRARAGPFHPPF